MRNLQVAGVALVLAGAGTAQHSILFAMDVDEFVLDGGGGLIGLGVLVEDEVGIVTPTGAGAYSAATFLSRGAQWAFLGDADMDGRLVDASLDGPGLGTSAVFVKRFTGAPVGPLVGPREVYVSKEGVDGFDGAAEDGDVFRYSAQGVREVFISEDQLLTAIGQPFDDLDLDAICQSDTGDLFVSFESTETVAGSFAKDGAVVRIPTEAINYDAGGNVLSVLPNSAAVVLGESDVSSMIFASGMATSVGGPPSFFINVTALEIDPAGGTFFSPLNPGLELPNLLFGWSGFSNDGAVLSTSGGGSIAAVNGIALASTTATTGTQIGLLPDDTGLGGLAGLALIPARLNPLIIEEWPSRLITNTSVLFTRSEASGGTPGAPAVFFTMFGPTAVGSSLPVLTAAPIEGHAFGDLTTLVILGVGFFDPFGRTSQVTNLPGSLVGTSSNMAFQVFDAFGLGQFGTPAALQYA